jgi:hypothetical protein
MNIRKVFKSNRASKAVRARHDKMQMSMVNRCNCNNNYHFHQSF